MWASGGSYTVKKYNMHTEIIVLQQVEVAHLLSHCDLLHSALVQVELLSNVNIAIQNTPHSQFNIYLVFTTLLFKCLFFLQAV